VPFAAWFNWVNVADTRRWVDLNSITAKDESPDEVLGVLRAFAQPSNRLVTLEGDSGDVIAEVTHEALIRQWEKLRKWLGPEQREDERFRRRFAEATVDWDTNSRRPDLLWRGFALGRLREFAKRTDDDLTLLEQSFLQASSREEISTKRRQIWRTASVWCATVVALALIGYLGYFEYLSRQQKEFAKRNFELAINSAQQLLNKVGDSLNRGNMTVMGAKNMLSVAAEIVDQVSIVKTEQAVSLFAKFYLTASDINATLKDDRHAYESAKEARVLVEPFYVDDPNNPKLLKLFYDSVWRMGDAIAGENFDAATQKRALKEYIEAERLARRLSVLDPDNDDRKSALAFVLLKIGDVWQAMDDWESAITAYSSALEVLQKAIDKTPENPDLQRNHANALSRVGQALAGKGNRDAATKHFGAALEIRSKLAAADRSNDVLQSNLATSHREIAKLHEKYGERDQALAEYDLAIRIRENLLSRDGSNDTWKSYLASLYTEKGNILESKRNLDVALGQYQMAHKLRLELALRDPANSGLQYNLATAGMSIADLLVKQNGDLDEAVRLYQGAIMVLDDFLPSFPRYDEDVFWCHIKIGDILRVDQVC
jgi:tetratricopeptide (TPR) repeat protein